MKCFVCKKNISENICPITVNLVLKMGNVLFETYILPIFQTDTLKSQSRNIQI